MSDTVIKVEGLSKFYRIGSRQSDYRTLRDTITDTFTTFFRKQRKRPEGEELEGDSNLSALGSPLSADTIWALKDVSFEIKRGAVVGIIGRNGAGKSTLLKILSRITEPTQGHARIQGRVGSLLEVGTGFHPELTGRENIYLNGAILGMRKAEIERKFDEIVAFAEVERFIDTPIKYYSSGMYVRLAFAVAAHLDPEILLVDEVLSVGDAAFQKKCLGKMGEVSREGRTVLFVSHNLQAVSTLTGNCFVLNNGYLSFSGDTSFALRHYRGIWNNTNEGEYVESGKSAGLVRA
jgi:lipopolysaccharide transport system ATP-binding protein